MQIPWKSNQQNEISKSKLPGKLENKIQHKNTRYKENPRKQLEHQKKVPKTFWNTKRISKIMAPRKEKIYDKVGNFQQTGKTGSLLYLHYMSSKTVST